MEEDDQPLYFINYEVKKFIFVPFVVPYRANDKTEKFLSLQQTPIISLFASFWNLSPQLMHVCDKKYKQ